MNDIRAPTNSRDNNWNNVACNPLSEAYQQMPISNKFYTLRFDCYDETTDPDKHYQHFLALMMIQNASDVQLCQLFLSSLWDSALCWLAS